MNRRLISPSGQTNQHQYATSNPSQPFCYIRELPTAPKKQIQYDTDAITQSRSFQILEDWISKSEKKRRTSTNFDSSSLSAFEMETQRPSSQTTHRASLSFLPSRSFRYLQDQYKEQTNSTSTTPLVEPPHVSAESRGLRRSSDAHTPSRTFQFLQRQYPVNNRDDLQEIYNRTPPSLREREPETPRYNGAKVPSRSFRFLQQMTSDDQSKEMAKSNFSSESERISNENQFNQHPSRSFRYRQQLTGSEQSNPLSSSVNHSANFHN